MAASGERRPGKPAPHGRARATEGHDWGQRTKSISPPEMSLEGQDRCHELL